MESAPFEIGLVGALGRGIEANSENKGEGVNALTKINLLQSKVKFELYGYKGADRHPIVEYNIEEFILHDKTELEKLTPQEIQARIHHYLRFNIPLDVCIKLTPKDGQSYDRIRLEKVDVEAPWKLITSQIKIGPSSKQSSSKDIGRNA